MSVLFIPHGGGPLPLLDDPQHKELIKFYQEIPKEIKNPSTIIVLSAHWEEEPIHITSGKTPDLIYDYYGFPDETYNLDYPAPGNPHLAKVIHNLLHDNGIKSKLDKTRGFDHGLFVPLLLMYPNGDIPCIQISLSKSLDPETHIKLGRALSQLNSDDVLFLGSGMSFHNMNEFFSKNDSTRKMSQEFDNWLTEICTGKDLSIEEKDKRLIHWEKAPHGRYCHPREEHLLPLLVCFGISKNVGKQVFNGLLFDKMVSGYLW